MIKNIVFDFGGVLIDWNPRHLFRELFNNEEEMEYFLENVCTYVWNEQQDAGRPFDVAIEDLKAKHPEYKKMIQYYYDDFEKMLAGEIEENTKLLPQIKKKYRLFGLTNWSAETFPIAQRKFKFLDEFEGIVVSGIEKVIKPNKEIFHILLERFQINAKESIFIDDSPKNIKTAEEIGFHTIHYSNGINVERELKKLGLI
jgi:2-haloacid dehalogenase